MSSNDRLISAEILIKQHEGRRLQVYDDFTGQPIKPGSKVIGHPTIGWGRALDVNGITATEADRLLHRDLLIAEQIAREFAGPVWTNLSTDRAAVLIDMAYNLGPEGLASFVRLQEAIQTSNFKWAAQEMWSSKWAGQVGTRAVRLIAIMRAGSIEKAKVA